MRNRCARRLVVSRALERLFDRIKPRQRNRRPVTPEALEARTVLSASLPNIQVLSATTPDSRVVVVDYAIAGDLSQRPITFEVYRSADDRLDPLDRSVGSSTRSTDATGASATAEGIHRITIPLPDGLPPNPSRPYVLVAADPGGALPESTREDNVAGFRKHVIGVVVHGLQTSGSGTPLWEAKLARALRDQGYEQVIPYTWSDESRTAGSAAKQGPRVANIVRKLSEFYPETEPVDLHLIGHSEGAVVVSQALLALHRSSTPQLQAGYTKATFLDPHAANNNAPGGQVSVSSGFDGWLAKKTIHSFQAMANDPLVTVPDDVEAAEVYYQHTPVQVNGANDGMYNLWGQVPIVGEAQYSDLTGPGVAHSGGHGVQVWYAFNVVPRLADGDGSFYNPTRITGERVPTPGTTLGAIRDATVTTERWPTYLGTATPGTPITILAQRPGTPEQRQLGKAVTDPWGNWTVETQHPLAAGVYRTIARGMVPTGMPSPRTFLYPSVLLERLIVTPTVPRGPRALRFLGG